MLDGLLKHANGIIIGDVPSSRRFGVHRLAINANLVAAAAGRDEDDFLKARGCKAINYRDRQTGGT